MADTTLPDITPSMSSSKKVNARILKNEFGDGYSQRAADGLNNTPSEWSLTWAGQNKDDIDTLEAFFEARGGWDAFNWIPYRESSTKQFTCSEWSRNFDGAHNDTLTAKLDEVYDL